MGTVESLLLAALSLALLAAIAYFTAKSLRVYKEYERGVRFRLGRFNKVTGPGISLSLPYLDSTTMVDMRASVMEFPALRALTREKATVFVDAVVRYRISSPSLSVIKVADTEAALRAVSETAIRGSIGELSFDSLVEKREFISARLRETVSSQAEKWGITVEGVELTDVIPSERTMASLARARGEKINNPAGNNRRARARIPRGRKRR